MAVATSKKGQGTEKRPCKNSTCLSPFQDKLYGMGIRVMNIKTNGSRCSVCGTETKTF